MGRTAAIIAICRKTKCVVLSDGRIGPFTSMYDEEGDEVADIALAVSAVARHPDGGWMAINLEEFNSALIH